MRWLIAAGVISLVVGCGYQIAAPKVQLDLAVVVADRSLETEMQKALEQALVDPSVDQSDRRPFHRSRGLHCARTFHSG